MSRADLHFRLRLPPDLKAKLEAEAAANHRSVTAEIVDQLSVTAGRQQLDRIEAALARIEKAVAA